MPPIVRFAPSPTGFLHIGSARTALFNWLYAKHHGGKLLLRIEDTDRARSTPQSVETILDGLNWLELGWEGEPISQFARFERHAAVAKEMVAAGKAYYCYASQKELEEMRAEQKAKNLPLRYDGRWRDRSPEEAPQDVKPVIRLRAPQTGETTVNDAVMGTITVQNAQLDDMVLLRADGTPTYMHAVVVDDFDMNITHVIRGDDHMTNTFRQVQIYKAMGWDLPQFAHLPMILGPDGAKLSKRHGAPAVSDYRDRGYLREAVRNYLLRLCWSHGNDEIISTPQAIEWFDFGGIGKSPARFDFVKLGSINAHYMKEKTDAELADLAAPFLEKMLNRKLTDAEKELLVKAMPDLKPRAQTLIDVAEQAKFYFYETPLTIDEKAQKILTPEGKDHLRHLAQRLEAIQDFSAENIEKMVREFAEGLGAKLNILAQPLRAALTGSTVSPPIFSAVALLGKVETLKRLAQVTKNE